MEAINKRIAGKIATVLSRKWKGVDYMRSQGKLRINAMYGDARR